MVQFKVKVKGIVEFQGKYLLVKTWFDDRISEPFQWDFIMGDMNFGESPEYSVVNMISEKTNLSVGIDRILYTWNYIVGETQYVGLTFLCHAESDIIFLSEDLIDYIWVDKSDFEEYISNDSVLSDITKISWD